jgi:HSP20 family protein
MTNIVRWDPFGELRTTMDRLFDEGFSRPWRFLSTDAMESTFPVEVSETDQDVQVKAALPGLKPEDVDITITNDVLTIKGEHREQTEEKSKEFYRREIRYGSFHRSLSLPTSVDVERAEGKFENGILSLKLPKAEAVRPKQIKVAGA